MSKSKQKFFPTETHHTEEKLQALSTVPLKEVPLKAANPSQRFYIKTLTGTETPYVVAHGPAGTGKTFLAVLYAIQQLRDGHIKKVIITRPMVGAGGEELGFLPGDLNSKFAPWAIPIIDAFEEFYSVAQVARMIENKVIEFAPLALMRGRTLKNALIIADESQNTTCEQMLMLVTRLGQGSRMIITGDVEQHDRGYAISGLADLLQRIERNPELADDFAVHTFRKSDSVRHRAIENVLHLYATDKAPVLAAA